MNESLGLFGWTKLNVYGERNGAIYLAKWYLFEHICQTEFFFLFYFETIWWMELKNLGKYFKLKKKIKFVKGFQWKISTRIWKILKKIEQISRKKMPNDVQISEISSKHSILLTCPKSPTQIFKCSFQNDILWYFF